MHYNNQSRFVFLHMPKTGGTFLDTYFNQIAGTYDDVFRPHNKKKSTDWHWGINEALQYIEFPLDTYATISTVRNPFDMYVSLYEYTKQNGFHEWNLFKDLNDLSFEGWLKRIVTLNYREENLQGYESDKTSTGAWYREMQQESNEIGWITYRWKKTTHIDGIDKVNYYLRQENLSNDFASLLETIYNSPKSFTNAIRNSPRRNKTRGRKPYKEYYTEELVELVNKREAEYLSTFNYQF